MSFRTEWQRLTEPVELGPEVNSPSIQLCPMVTSDGKYLFFRASATARVTRTGLGPVSSSR